MPETQCCCYTDQQGSFLKKQNDETPHHVTKTRKQPPTYRMFLKPTEAGYQLGVLLYFCVCDTAWIQAEKMVLSEIYFRFLTQQGCLWSIVFFPLFSPSKLPDFNQYLQLPKHCEDISFKEDLNPGPER